MKYQYGEKYPLVAPPMPSARDLAHNPDMCSDWELNQQPFGHRPALNPLTHTSQGYFSDQEQPQTFPTVEGQESLCTLPFSNQWMGSLQKYLG